MTSLFIPPPILLSMQFETKIAIVVLHELEAWQRANATAFLVSGIATAEPGRPYAGEYRLRHNLPAPSSVQRAIEALVGDELIGRDEDGEFRIVEPFLAEWIIRNEI